MYPNVYSGPQHWHAYYDATWHRPFSSHPHPVPLFASMSGPYLPSISPPSTALVTDAMSESPLASLRALRSQFAAFQESLGEVKADVKDALSQLHALRTAQNKTHNRIAELEGVIGVSSTGTASRGRGRPGRERGRSGRHAEPTLEGADAIVPEKTLVQSLASIQYAVEELLVRECGTSQSRECLFSSFVSKCESTLNLSGRSITDPSGSDIATTFSTICKSYRTGIFPDIIASPTNRKSISTVFDIAIYTICFYDLVRIAIRVILITTFFNRDSYTRIRNVIAVCSARKRSVRYVLSALFPCIRRHVLFFPCLVPILTQICRLPCLIMTADCS